MTDKETLTSMFDRAKVKYSIDNIGMLEVCADGYMVDDGPNQGYDEFYAVFKFDNDGSLQSVGVWE